MSIQIPDQEGYYWVRLRQRFVFKQRYAPDSYGGYGERIPELDGDGWEEPIVTDYQGGGRWYICGDDCSVNNDGWGALDLEILEKVERRAVVLEP